MAMTEQEQPGDPAAETPEADAGALRIAELEDELARTKDQLLRALAEQENVRRRAQRDRDEQVKYAAAAFAKDLISTPDNLRRALESVKESDLVDDVAKNLLAGVAATERELLATFERNGIRRIDPLGEKFDHNFHQALFEVENTGKPAGTVVQVMVPGYVLHDRLLRAAMVGVAKGDGGAKAEPAPATEPEGAPKFGKRRIDTTV
jgi:molecular chaperone GrpE